MLAFLPGLILFPVKLVGKKNLKSLKGRNYILSCNHMSNFDSFMIDLKLMKKHYILAKKELFENKFSSFFLKKLGGIPIDRGNVSPVSLKEVFNHLNKGKNIIIFPQGTRMKTPFIDENSAKDGVAMFSLRTGVPVVPVMISKKLGFFKRAKIIFGEPIYPDTEKKKDREYVAEFADNIISKMNDLLEGEKK